MREGEGGEVLGTWEEIWRSEGEHCVWQWVRGNREGMEERERMGKE